MAEPLPWNESFSLGHPALDREHRDLLDAVNRIGAMSAAGAALEAIAAALGELGGVAANHFRHENEILQTIAENDGPYRDKAPFLRALSEAAIADHISEHERALEHLTSIAQDAISASDGAGRDLQDGLIHWFVSHAIKRDARLKTLLQAIATDCPGLLGQLP